jgi:hypothetical protein
MMFPVSMGWWFAVLVLLGACPGSTPPQPRDMSRKSLQVTGRVVDFETCFAGQGCTGAPNLRVALFANSAIISDKTKLDGAFVLRGVPVNSKLLLLVSDSSGSNTFLSTLQAAPIATTTADLYGVEIYALRREGGLFAALGSEVGINLTTHAVYIGQVYYVDPKDNAMTPLAWATATVTPAMSLRYFNCNPRFVKTVPCPVALFDPKDRTATGPFGEFVAYAQGKVAATFNVASTSYACNPVVAPLNTGYVTLGLHLGTRAGDAGVHD